RVLAAVGIGCSAASLSLTVMAPAGTAAPSGAPSGSEALSRLALATTSWSAGRPRLVLPALGLATVAALPGSRVRGGYGRPPIGWRLAAPGSPAASFQIRSRKVRTQWTSAPSARLSGVVTGPDHQALAGICVAIDNVPPTQTDANGSYT